jgi:hypothetical protein
MAAESLAGVTQFDVGTVVRRWFAPQLADVPTGGSVIDPRLSVAYTLKGLGGVGWVQTYIALNAVAQVGESSSRNADEIISSFDHLTLYDGYPLDYSRTNANAMIERVDIIAQLPQTPVSVNTLCVPPSPFYVRWINERGGVDYFMFARYQTRVQSVDSSTLHEVYVPSTASALTNRRTTSIKCKNTVTVGVENISATEYRALQQLPFSPTIEWYSEELGKWIELGVAKFGGEYEADAPTSFEVEFNLPQIFTRF